MSKTKLVLGLLTTLLIVGTANAKCGGSIVDHATEKAKEVVSSEANNTVEKAKTTVKEKASDIVKGKCGVGKCG